MGVAFVEFGIRGLDGKRAAIRHGVARVHHQVHQDLLHLSRIRAHHSEVRRQPELEIDILANQAAQHRAHGGYQFVEVERVGLQGLAPAEGE